jgi:hypothetical protein
MFTTGAPTPNRRQSPKRDRRDYMRDFMARKRAAERDIKIPRVLNPDRRQACLADPLLFLSTYFPETYFNPWTPCQLEMAATITAAAQFGLKKAIAAPRGDGKTKTTEGLIVYCTLRGLIDFSVIVAATATLSQRILENLKRLLTTPSLAEDFPEVCVPLIALGGESKKATNQTANGGKRTLINWTKDYIQLPTIDGSACSGSIIYPLSIEGALRGLCIGERRPNFVLIDDPETRESAASEYQVGIREQILRQDVAGLQGAKQRMGQVALVTIQSETSLAYRLTDRTANPSWGGLRFRALEAWPERADLWDEYQHRRRAGQEAGDEFARDAHAFYVAHRDEMDRGAKLNNPYRFDGSILPDGTPKQVSALQACFDFITDQGLDAFRSEYQNDPRTSSEADAGALTARTVESRVAPALLRSELPEDSLGVVVAIDVGKYACHWAALSIGEEARCHVLEYGIAEVHGMSSQSSTQAVERAVVATLEQWREEIAAKTWRSPTGATEHKATFGLVDSGDGNLTDAIYAWVRSLPAEPRIGASKGFGQGQRKLAKSGARRISWHHVHAVLIPESGVWLYEIDSDYWKRWVHQRWRTPPWPDGAIQQTPFSLALHAPDRIRQHQPFSQHQVAEEYRDDVFVPGRGMVKGWAIVSPNNHWLDAVSMACAAGMAAGLIPVDPIAPTPTPETDVTPAPKRQASEPRRQTSLGRLNGRRTYLARPRR